MDGVLLMWDSPLKVRIFSPHHNCKEPVTPPIFIDTKFKSLIQNNLLMTTEPTSVFLKPSPRKPHEFPIRVMPVLTDFPGFPGFSPGIFGGFF